jgi:molybdate transport system ATP-binding protein
VDPLMLEAELHTRRGAFALDLALRCAPGEVVALLGPNGSGKTTALQAIAGLLPLTNGEIRVGGVLWSGPQRQLAPQLRSVGLVAADHLLFPHLSALRNVVFGPRSRGMSRASAEARARTELAAVGLEGLADRLPAQLSHGQAQRVALARALATDPEVLLLDEPLAALDPQSRPAIRAGLGARLRTYPGATILVTHDPLDALALADRLVFVENGHIVQEGPPREIVERPRNRYVAQVAGLNLLRGHAGSDGRIRVGAAPEAVVVAAEPVEGVESAQDSPCWVAFAPRSVALYDTAPGGSPRNTWPGTVTRVELLGQSARIHLCGPVDLVAEVTLAGLAALHLEPGSPVWASVKATEVTAYPA